MKINGFLFTVIIIGISLPVFADKTDEDSRDFLYMAEQGPVFFRLYIQVDGHSFQQAWTGYVTEMFNDLDANDDGVLTGKEFESIPDRNQIARMGFIVRGNLAANQYAADANPRDHKVTRKEFFEYFRKLGLQALTMSTQPARNFQSQFAVSRAGFSSPARDTSRLFGRLDKNQDTKLSIEEVLSAKNTLAKLDLDEDETFSQTELGQFQNPYLSSRPNTTAGSGSTEVQPRLAALTTSDETPLLKIVETIIARYDLAGASKKKDEQLSKEEAGLRDDRFTAADLNKNDVLDVAEILKFVQTAKPDIELVLRLGKRDENQAAVEVLQVTDRFKEAIEVSESGVATITFGKDQIDLNVMSAQATNTTRVTASFNQLFKRADTDKNEYLDQKEATASGYFRTYFTLMDRDKDGKIYEKEMQAYFKRSAKAAQSQLTLSMTDQGSSLFGVLDDNKDLRLTVREIQAAKKLIDQWDDNSDGQLSLSEMPHRKRITLQRGRGRYYARPQVLSTAAGRTRIQASRTTRTGPVWFQKMDRNSDGEVSRKEFLGKIDVFDRLDKNQDQFLDDAEAAALTE